MSLLTFAKHFVSITVYFEVLALEKQSYICKNCQNPSFDDLIATPTARLFALF